MKITRDNSFYETVAVYDHLMDNNPHWTIALVEWGQFLSDHYE